MSAQLCYNYGVNLAKGCEESPVEAASWGSIKAMFR